MIKFILLTLLFISSLIALEKPSNLPAQSPVQDAVDNIQLLEGRLLRQQLYEEQYRKQQENAKKRQEYLKEQEKLKKQKRIDANEEARKQNEAYYKSQQTGDNNIDNPDNGLIIIKKTSPSDINKSH